MNVRRRLRARRLRSAAGSINSGRHILESRCAERCANDEFLTSFRATLRCPTCYLLTLWCADLWRNCDVRRRSFLKAHFWSLHDQVVHLTFPYFSVIKLHEVRLQTVFLDHHTKQPSLWVNAARHNSLTGTEFSPLPRLWHRLFFPVPSTPGWDATVSGRYGIHAATSGLPGMFRSRNVGLFDALAENLRVARELEILCQRTPANCAWMFAPYAPPCRCLPGDTVQHECESRRWLEETRQIQRLWTDVHYWVIHMNSIPWFSGPHPRCKRSNWWLRNIRLTRCASPYSWLNATVGVQPPDMASCHLFHPHHTRMGHVQFRQHRFPQFIWDDDPHSPQDAVLPSCQLSGFACQWTESFVINFASWPSVRVRVASQGRGRVRVRVRVVVFSKVKVRLGIMVWEEEWLQPTWISGFEVPSHVQGRYNTGD